jgi:hypothetical protein
MNHTSNDYPHIAISKLATTKWLDLPNDRFTFPHDLGGFAEEIKKSMEGVQVKIYENFTGGFGRSIARTRGGDYSAPVGVVYYPEETYVRGFITFHDLRKPAREAPFNVSPHTVPTFNVHSPYICNERNSSRDIARYTVKSKTLKTGVANARKWLQAYDASMVFSATNQIARDMQDRAGVDLSHQLDRAVKSVTGARYGTISKRLSRELKHLHKTQHKFVDAAYADDVLTYIQAEQEVAEFRDHINKCFYMVTVAERLKQPWFGICRMEAPSSSSISASTLDHCANTLRAAHNYKDLREEFKTLPEMPDTLMGKMSVLSVMPSGVYIKEVGIKINDNVYFLYGGDTA